MHHDEIERRNRAHAALDKLEAMIPDERRVMLAAAAAPAAFQAVHGCSASEYLAKFRELREALAEIREAIGARWPEAL